MKSGGESSGRISLISIIRDRMGDLTPSERRLADVIMSSEEVVALSTAGDLARMAGVSEATVSRFCNNIGFPRYADMQSVARRTVLHLLEQDVPARLDRSYEGAQSFGELMQKVVEMDSENLWYSFRGAPQILEDLVEDLAQCRRVYCLGDRSSSFPAGYLAFSLNFLRSGVRSMVGDVGDGVNVLLDSEPGDVMVVFANARYPRDTTTLVRVAAESDLRVYLLTDSLACPACSYTDRVISVRGDSLSITCSLVAFFSMVNVLVAGVGISLDRSSVGDRLANLEEKYESTEYYHRFPTRDLARWGLGALGDEDGRESATDDYVG
ncbi:MAG: MurR/RpiR family transcriptional regulator [Bacillota bacterium]